MGKSGTGSAGGVRAGGVAYDLLQLQLGDPRTLVGMLLTYRSATGKTVGPFHLQRTDTMGCVVLRYATATPGVYGVLKVPGYEGRILLWKPGQVLPDWTEDDLSEAERQQMYFVYDYDPQAAGGPRGLTIPER
jgi:hypothetical protein